MIPKFMCWLFGHKKWTDVYTGDTGLITNRLTGAPMVVPVVRPERNEVCPRCGEKL